MSGVTLFYVRGDVVLCLGWGCFGFGVGLFWVWGGVMMDKVDGRDGGMVVWRIRGAYLTKLGGVVLD